MSGMFRDSKHFVDMPGKYSPDRILADWQLFCSCKKNESSLKHLTNFVENHFDSPGSEIEYWSPPDWRCEPAYLANVKDPELRKFATALNLIWKKLGRHSKDCVRSNPLMYSLVYVPNPVIVPGGRFNEFYYWDTYWIVRGLLHSGMIQTARGMIDNFLYIVSQYKFVPNGGRIYYWGRSQPPLLVPMVKTYVEMTKDQKYAVQVLPILEMEMDNFLKNHAVQVKGRTMYQYRDKSSGPRPEAYREDVASASGFVTDAEKEEHYSHLKAACESGMDFSSRWFVSPCGNNVGTLANIKTTWIVPVDLNCILFRNCKTLAEFNTWAGNNTRAEHYRTIAGSLIKAITAVLWNKERGVWFDYDLKNKVPRDYFVVTNLSPLWARAYPINEADKITESVMSYIEENKLDSFPGGVPHTLSNTGEQWDYPNVWPPMMHMLIEGFNNLGTPPAKELSQRWRERWVRSNYDAFKKSGFAYEKYNCEEFGSPGFGGEQPNQTGYGWTNAVLIELLARYGQELTAADATEAADGVCTCNDDVSTGVPILEDSLEDCPITSELYLEQKAQNTQTVPTNTECGESAPEVECCSVICCHTVYEEEEPAKEIESFATSEQECGCGQEVIPPPQPQPKVCTAPAPTPAKTEQAESGCCPMCKDCQKPQKPLIFALASDMASQVYCPPQIDLNEGWRTQNGSCPMNLTPSQEQEIMAECGCESSEATMDTVVCSQTEDEEQDDEYACTAPCSGAAAPSAAPVTASPIKNKIFPLADSMDDNCFDLKKDKESNTDKTCMCYLQKTDKEKSPKECD
ncbi:trehalase [Drosophila innubila]|uniref:trehalase n=1 Tax=Drosophila innubila TaxID=198719 RepID=UPI00148CC780|nr:trehalase [Drosophila innubila]